MPGSRFPSTGTPTSNEGCGGKFNLPRNVDCTKTGRVQLFNGLRDHGADEVPSRVGESRA